MKDDRQLLREFAREGSEAALAELVSRHIGLVYSAALRVASGNASMAQDAAQTVFIYLAQNAPRLPEDALLPAWLHRRACYAALTLIRTESRRKNREQIAVETGTLTNDGSPAWETLAPHVDAALDQLGDADRNAIVLRFLQQMDFRALGAALGVSEDAAQKRVSRALEKLRAILKRRGVTVSASALAALMAAHATASAAVPAGLAASATTAALAAPAKSATLLTLLKFMAASNTKTGLAALLAAAGILTPILLHNSAQATLRERDQALQAASSQLASIVVENQRLTARFKQARSSAAPVSEAQLAEVLRLRNETSLLAAKARALTSPDQTPEERLEARKQFLAAQVVKLKDWINAHPNQNIPELAKISEDDWLHSASRDYEFSSDDEFRRAASNLRLNAELHVFLDPVNGALRKYAKANNGQFPSDLTQLKPYFRKPSDDAIMDRYEIVSTSSLVSELRSAGDWAITQKAPVDEDFDDRIAVGLNNEIPSVGQNVTNRWNRVR